MIKPKDKSLSSLVKEADKVFSEYIRKRDTKDGRINCFICGSSLTFAQADAMHFIDRDQMAVRFDEVNVNAGCKDCNRFDPLHKTKYENMMILNYGFPAIDRLHMKSRSLAKFTRFELGEIIDEYKTKIKELK